MEGGERRAFEVVEREREERGERGKSDTHTNTHALFTTPLGIK